MAITTYAITGNPIHGTASIDLTTGISTYIPTSGYVGTDSYNYSILCDGVAVSTATINMTVTAGAVTASAGHFIANVTKGTTLNSNVTCGGVLPCTTVPCSAGATTYKLIPVVGDLAASATFIFNLNGTYSYGPPLSEPASATQFTYGVYCDNVLVSQNFVTININTACNAGNTPLTFASPTISNVCPAITADLGSVVITNVPVGTQVIWGTNTNFTESGRLTNLNVPYAVNGYYARLWDSINNCYSPASQTNRVDVIINSCATNSGLLVDISKTVLINNTSTATTVVAGTNIICNGNVTYRIKAGTGTNGTWSITNAGVYSYTPTINFIGNAVAIYEVLCNGVVLDEAAINVSVTAVVITADATPKSISATKGSTISINATTGNTACSSGMTYYKISTNPTKGTATISPTGVISYSSFSNAVGNDFLNYDIVCGGTLSNGTIVGGSVIDTARVDIIFVGCEKTVTFEFNPSCGIFQRAEVVNSVTNQDVTILQTSTTVKFIYDGLLTSSYTLNVYNSLNVKTSKILTNLTCN